MWPSLANQWPHHANRAKFDRNRLEVAEVGTSFAEIDPISANGRAIVQNSARIAEPGQV